VKRVIEWDAPSQAGTDERMEPTRR
jgi:hypothetical protein